MLKFICFVEDSKISKSFKYLSKFSTTLTHQKPYNRDPLLPNVDMKFPADKIDMRRSHCTIR